MKDPERLLDEGANGFETKLLRSGRTDAPADHNRRAIATALGVGGIFGASAVATGASASARTWLTLTTSSAVKVAGGVIAGAAALYTGVEVLDTPAPPPPPPPAAVTQRAPVKAPPPPAAEPAPPPADEKTSEPPARAATPPPPSPERAGDTLSLELQALDQARRALAAGDAALALTRLDDYARRFPKRTLSTEATVLRIEALKKSGDSALAQRLGREFLSKQPNGPYARRVQSLMGDPPGP